MKIDELTMRAGKINSASSQQYVNQNKESWFNDGELIGQIDNYDLRKQGDMYSLWDKDSYAASAQLTDDSQVNLLHVDSNYRNQKIVSRLLWNFKTRQKRSRLILNQYHSDDLYDVLAAGGLSRFNKYWINAAGEKAPFDKTTIDNYYSHAKPTGWRLVLENDGDFADMPHFTEGKNWITEDYSWQIE